MEDLHQQVLDLKTEIDVAAQRLEINKLLEQKSKLDHQMSKPGFWTDPARAQEKARQQAQLERRTKPWVSLQQDINDLLGLIELDDESMRADLSQQLNTLIQNFAALKEELKFTGPFDDHDVILTIYAGAGGTDAQDWAQILLRMYIRWAQNHNYTTKIVDEAAGEEAGIKSATLELSGSEFLYGKLKGEHGVHRLVRLSPFNSAGSRETSFAKVDVLPKIDRPDEVKLDDIDLRIDVFRAGGHGGQSVNTTDSAVRVTHIPSDVSVVIQNERSQLQNKETALTILRSRLAALQLEQHKEKLGELKGPKSAIEFGSQIRNYVLHPYRQVKDLRTGYETSDPEAVLNGDIDSLIKSSLERSLSH